jgi:ArsR family transcriptional regulator, cadmium/lead-responsive transcriptional repressor
MLVAPDLTTTTLKAKLFRGFSDPSRLSILEALRGCGLTVSEIVEKTGLSQSNVSNHLSCLFDCGLVHRQQKGRFVTYSLSDELVEKLLSISDELLVGAAKRIYACIHYNQESAR